MDDILLCKDCRHYRDHDCKHQMNMRQDYVNGGYTTRNSVDFLRADATRCGPAGAWHELRAVNVVA